MFEFRGVNLSCVIADMQVVELEALKRQTEESGMPDPSHGASQANRGVLMRQTAVQFSKSSGSTIKLKGINKS